MPDSVFLTLLGYGVASGRQGNSKSPLIIRGEGCDFRSLFVLHDESGIRERFRTGSIRPDRSTLSWTKRNHSFDPCSRSGLGLPRRKATRHYEEHQNYSEFSELHHLIILTTSNRVKGSDHERGERQVGPNDKTPDGLRATIDAALKEKS